MSANRDGSPTSASPSGSNGRRGLGVVVGYDGSLQAQVAVRWAAAEAVRRGRPLTVMYVVNFTGMGIDPTSSHVDDWPRPALEAGRVTADEGVLLATRTVPAVDARALVTAGAAAEVFIEDSRQAELVVLGTRGRGNLASVCLGSVSTAASAHALCPVVIVRGEHPPIPGPGFPVVVGVDGSTSSMRAVDVAARAAAEARASLRVVTVWNGLASESWMGAFVAMTPPDAVDELLKASRAVAERTSDLAVDRARQAYPGLEVSRLVVEGQPAAALVAATKDAGLLVVGTRGHGAFTSLVLGSVSHGVVHAATCPVMVVAPKTARSREPAAAPAHVMI